MTKLFLVSKFLSTATVLLATAPIVINAMSNQEIDLKLNNTLMLLDEYREKMTVSIDSFWCLFAAFLVYFMQAGFALLEAGTIRGKNTCNILVKNICDCCTCSATFYMFGYGLAFGSDSSGFVGTSEFLLSENENGHHFYIFQFAFAATAATIVSGAVAERCRFQAYLVYTILITGVIYPIVVHWVWGGGWLAQMGFADFAGSGVVHMVGGTAGMIGSAITGPRRGRYKGSFFRITVNTNDFEPSHILMVTLGVFILWFGWFGFNAGSSLALTGGGDQVAALAAMNTTISPAVAVLTVFVFGMIRHKLNPSLTPVDLANLLNCALAGLVAITAGCAMMPPYYACVVGFVSTFVYLGCSHLSQQCGIDDCLDAAPIHFGCGLWGVLAVGLFSTEAEMTAAGFDYVGVGPQLGVQLAGGLAIFAWSALTSLSVFVPLQLSGMLRVTPNQELAGLDIYEHSPKGDKLVEKIAQEAEEEEKRLLEKENNKKNGRY